ncbi:MAG TPA: hypothetical protein VFQ77_04975 [Pseudonocardiaceae bacterium]|jgi:hypothetical protein|nr:hypothetical protein [Pseudonocardiaceae bacterium]
MAKPQSTPHTKETNRNSEDLLGEVEVRPGQMESISLGMYEQGMPEPTLIVELEPDMPDTVNGSLIRLDKDDHYTLVYQVQNFGDVTCQVRVWSE